MNQEGKVSKVSICEQCQGYILACHIDFLETETEKEFTYWERKPTHRFLAWVG